jgi:hypothetical protein
MKRCEDISKERPMSMTPCVLRPMSLGGLFKEAFGLYKKHFLLLITMAGVLLIPGYFIMYGFHRRSISIGYLLLVALCNVLVITAITRTISLLCLGRTSGVLSSYRSAFSRFVALVWTAILSGIFVYMPGFILAAVLANIPGLPRVWLASAIAGVVTAYLLSRVFLVFLVFVVVREGSNIVVLAPDVAEAFPNEEAVNDALRLLMSVAKSTSRKAS